MQIEIYLFLAKCSLFCIQYNLVLTKALIGTNVHLVNEGQFNFVVSLVQFNYLNLERETDHKCTGSLITPMDILTASHGFDELQLLHFQIIAGSVDLRSGQIYHPAWWTNYIRWITYNNLVNPSSMCAANSDVAIIRLITPVSSHINPVVILPMPFTGLFGTTVTIAGWGKTLSGNVCRYMKKAILNVLTKDDCENKLVTTFGVSGFIPENIICTVADPFILTTPGDSGSPVLYQNLLVAIHKGVTPHLPNQHPSQVNAHISLSVFTEFILNILNTR